MQWTVYLKTCHNFHRNIKDVCAWEDTEDNETTISAIPHQSLVLGPHKWNKILVTGGLKLLTFPLWQSLWFIHLTKTFLSYQMSHGSEAQREFCFLLVIDLWNKRRSMRGLDFSLRWSKMSLISYPVRSRLSAVYFLQMIDSSPPISCQKSLRKKTLWGNPSWYFSNGFLKGN